MGEERKNWIFTFGSGQLHEGYYVKFFDTWSEARIRMLNMFGNKFAFQYSEEEWNDYVKKAEERAVEMYGDKRFAMIEKELKL